MRTSMLFILFFSGCTALSLAQNLNSYKYVEVPEKYEFQDEENEYQLNALTAFLFEKHGFKVLYRDEIPKGTDPCEILKADVEDESSFFRTKVKVILKDCYNTIVFTSEEGKSRFKDYKRSFQDALRNAFASVKDLDYNYEAPPEEKGIVAFKIKKAKNPEAMGNTSQQRAKKLENGTTTPEKSPASVEIDAHKTSEEKDATRKFANGNTEYRLEKTAAGYALFKADEKEQFATLIKSGAGKNFIYASQKLQGAAYFDELGNLVVEYISPETGQLVSLEYKSQN